MNFLPFFGYSGYSGQGRILSQCQLSLPRDGLPETLTSNRGRPLGLASRRCPVMRSILA